MLLERMPAMRAYMRAKTIGGVTDETAAIRISPEEAIEDMYQVMAIASFEDRFVVHDAPHRELSEDAYDLRSACGFLRQWLLRGGAGKIEPVRHAQARRTPMEVE